MPGLASTSAARIRSGRHHYATFANLEPAPLKRSLSPKANTVEACVDPSQGASYDCFEACWERVRATASCAPFHSFRDSDQGDPDDIPLAPAQRRPALVSSRRWPFSLACCPFGLATLTAVLALSFPQVLGQRSTDPHGRHRRRAQPDWPACWGITPISKVRRDERLVSVRARGLRFACPMRRILLCDEARWPPPPAFAVDLRAAECLP